MQGEDSEEGEMEIRLSEKLSFCSTNTSFQSYFSDYFYIDSENSANNLVRIQLNDQKLIYTQNRHLHVRSLFFNTLEDSIFLRNEKVVYAIKLVDYESTITILTYEKNSFIEFYLRLAKICVLTGFEKHYRVGKLLGTGTFAEVYDGFNILSHENVALKVIQKEKIKQTEHGFRMLQNEIQILENMRKYRISPLISTYETIDCFILVLEKGPGGHLFDYIQSNASIYGEKMLKCIFKQVLEILSILHHSGIIHRDIKPENIICKGSENPSIFLCDYSISLKKSEMNPEHDNYSAGTIGYVAPEIVNEKAFDEKCDIFSVGCMFFYLYTGKKLFETKSFERLQDMCENGDYIEKRFECLNHLSCEVRDLLEKLLEFNPKYRFSANEALKHSYFENSDIFFPNLGENDETLREFLEKKIINFWK